MSERRDRVHELLLDGMRPRDIETELSISGAGLAKHINALRSQGVLGQVTPAMPGIHTAEPDGAGCRVVPEFPSRMQVGGWVLAVPTPKVIDPDERGTHGHADWHLMVVGPHVHNVRCWVHMRGQRISERDVATRLAGTTYSRITHLVTLALGCATGLEVVLEQPRLQVAKRLEAGDIDATG